MSKDSGRNDFFKAGYSRHLSVGFSFKEGTLTSKKECFGIIYRFQHYCWKIGRVYPGLDTSIKEVIALQLQKGL
jgi:hypothetical protein